MLHEGAINTTHDAAKQLQKEPKGGGRFPHDQRASSHTAQNQPAAKLASTRDTHAQTRRRIDTQTKPAHGTNSLRQSSHATPDQTKHEAPPQIRQCDRKRAHATPHQWVTTARPRDAKERSLGNDAQWVTVPIYRSCAIRYSSPIQVAHGSYHSVRGD